MAKTTKKPAKNPQALPVIPIAILTLILGVMSGALVLYLGANRTPQFAQAAEQGDVVKTVPIDVTLNYVKTAPAKELMSRMVIENNTGYIVGVTVKNNTDTEQYFLPVNQAFIKGVDGKVHNLAPVAGVQYPIQAGAVPAGESLSGEFSFIVPDSIESPRLFIDTQWSGVVPIVFSLD